MTLISSLWYLVVNSGQCDALALKDKKVLKKGMTSMFYYQGQIIRSSNCYMNEEKINAMFFKLWEIFTKQMENTVKNLLQSYYDIYKRSAKRGLE